MLVSLQDYDLGMNDVIRSEADSCQVIDRKRYYNMSALLAKTLGYFFPTRLRFSHTYTSEKNQG